MSASKGRGKKGKKEVEPEPEPEPEVPEVREPTEEELEAERNAIAAEKSRQNCSRVLFVKPTVKHIVSPHSGTILAECEPRPPLEESFKATASGIFEASATDGRMDILLLPELLVECGFIASPELILKHLPKFLPQKEKSATNKAEDSESNPLNVSSSVASEQSSGSGAVESPSMQLTLIEFLTVLESFHAPAYHFGARLRKYAARDQYDEVEQLLVRNCPANTGNGEGLTPLHYCCEYDRPRIIQLLRSIAKESLAVNAQDRYGWTPLHCAAHQGNIECIKLLLDYGADTSLVNKEGKSPLHAAAAQNRSAIVQILHDAGADVNMKDLAGMTPIHESTYRGHFSLYNDFARYPEADTENCDILEKKPIDYIDRPPSSSLSAGAGRERLGTPVK